MKNPTYSIPGKRNLRLEGTTEGTNFVPGKVHYCADLKLKNKGGMYLRMIHYSLLKGQRN